MTGNVLLLLTDGTEEMEAVITCDILSRAGLKVVRMAVATADGQTVHCANGMTLLADGQLTSPSISKDFDLLVLPGGGKGSKTFCQVIANL